MKAVVKIGSTQFLVAKGEEIEVDRMDIAPGGSVDIDKVLLVEDGGKVRVGMPKVVGAVVTAKVLENFKGSKVLVGKFKAKSRYRKVRGYRRALTRLNIAEIRVN